ncbi:MAG: 4-hydroxythreonine-4-phosphate dehydrogenase PdxA [Candidatus Omnitrophica bacterium]|nr:4-hydroxythreonine-4-phosphate dehydrogenase PdxA [Candidatus Omnitrophota bacterium]
MNRITIGITMGDPAGIGPEVLIKAVDKLSLQKLPINFLIIGDRCVLERYLLLFKIRNLFSRSNIVLVDLNNVPKSFRPGFCKPEYGRAALDYIDVAIRLLKKKEISALVTAPVSKEMINRSGKRFVGHTEYLSSSFKITNVMMMLANRYLRVVPLTRHISLKEVNRLINYSYIFKGIKIVAEYIKKYFYLSLPRIAICSLNPHGGEGGLLGVEEKNIIIPAVKKINKEHIANISGPYSADGLFSNYRDNKYDCIIGMYHDQVMIPVKMVDPQHTVNITLGLPFIRTSPGHGTAFDIAGKGIASFHSMYEAIKLTYQLSRNALSF